MCSLHLEITMELSCELFFFAQAMIFSFFRRACNFSWSVHMCNFCRTGKKRDCSGLIFAMCLLSLKL